MKIELQNLQALQICDLEYDAAGVGSAEAANSEMHLAAFVLLFSLPANS